MLRERAREIAAVVVVFDTILLSAAFIGAVGLRTAVLPQVSSRLGPVQSSNFLVLPLLLVPTTLLLLWRSGVYRALRRRTNPEIAYQLARAFVLQALLVGTLVFLLQLKGTSRTLVLLYLVLGYGALLIEKCFVRLVQRRIRANGYNTRNVVLVGQGSRLADVVAEIQSRPDLGFRILGVVSDHPAAVPADLPCLGPLTDLTSIVESRVVDAVFLALSPIELERTQNRILDLEAMGTQLLLRVDFLPTLLSRASLESLGGFPILALTSVPQGFGALALKRAIDVAVSAAALIVFAPILMLCAIAVRCDSRGPVLFRQRRVGLNGREFTLYKFRSMFEGEERVRREPLVRNEVVGPVFKMRRDPRVTRVGQVLRRFSVDELPQVWNVLRGDMSLVGPRPPLPREVAQYDRWQRRRLSVRPGLTCIWQVNGRSEVGFDRWVQMDMYYIDHWSLSLDMKILMQTIPAVFGARGAH